jgi:hypothetical protein
MEFKKILRRQKENSCLGITVEYLRDAKMEEYFRRRRRRDEMMII